MRFHRALPLTTRPTVSVVIPCYNYGHYLPAAVASAFDQRGVDVDVLIVDDASTDDSVAVARELAAADSRVRVLVHEQNQGHIRTYNDGLELARGDYVALLSADDVLAMDSLSRAAALMERHRSVGLVYGYARSFSGDVPTPGPQARRVRSWSVYPGEQWLELAARRGRCFLSSPEALVRRQALEQAGLYDPRLPHSADFDMWLKIAADWSVGRVNGPVQAWYRVHDANMHLTTYAGWLTDLEERRRTFDIFFAETLPRTRSANLARLHGTAFESLAREAVRRALNAARDGQAQAASAYLSFAEAVGPRPEPGITAAVAARWAELGRPVAMAAPLRGGERIRHHLRWRWERRYGT